MHPRPWCLPVVGTLPWQLQGGVGVQGPSLLVGLNSLLPARGLPRWLALVALGPLPDAWPDLGLPWWLTSVPWPCVLVHLASGGLPLWLALVAPRCRFPVPFCLANACMTVLWVLDMLPVLPSLDELVAKNVVGGGGTGVRFSPTPQNQRKHADLHSFWVRPLYNISSGPGLQEACVVVVPSQQSVKTKF